MSTKKSQRQKNAGGGTASRPLAWHQFQELNFSFYEEQPSNYINMRIEVLSLMLCTDEQLAPVYSAKRLLSGIELGGATPPSKEQRDHYIQTESVVILHHAIEMLLRLFYAHAEEKDCPWFSMASLVSFVEFKAKVTKSLDSGFDRKQIAEIFLGGASPKDSCIAMSEVDFDDAIDGLDLLLRECAKRLLSEAFLYNAIKHGLSTIALDPDTEIAHRAEDGTTVVGHKGPLFAYMHKPRWPGDNDKNAPKWFVSQTGANPEIDLSLAMLVARAVSSMWDVGRRRFTGRSGTVRHIRKSVLNSSYMDCEWTQ